MATDAIVYCASNLPSGLRFNASTAVIRGVIAYANASGSDGPSSSPTSR
jgi:hypothetical protein